MPARRVRSGNPIAVVDIGSNSGRVMVFERDTAGHLRLLAGSRAALRLVHDVDEDSALSEATMARTMEALRDFRAIAFSAGARRIVAVATAAMRDARNGGILTRRVRRELGIHIEIIEGLTEARYGFTGAVRGLMVANGLLFDLGGGSVQLTRFERRKLVHATSLPFGALRLSEKFLTSDPPSRKQLRRLRDHVRSQLARERVRPVTSTTRLVGTGGTVRNLAKIDRQTRKYPITSLHGYELSVDRLAEVVDRLAEVREKRRDEIPGLSAERADSIVGGAIAIQTLAEFVRAETILVSGQGVREGVALGMLDMAIASPDAVKEASLLSLISRFSGWRPDAASRRRSVAAVLQRALLPKAPESISLALDRAARVLDIGRSFDVLDRHEHVAEIMLTTDLTGFSHEELGLAAAVVQRAGHRNAVIPSITFPSEVVDDGWLERAAIVLALADEIEARCPHGRRITVECKTGRRTTLTVPLLPSWLAKDLDKRFERAFGHPLIVKHRT